MDGGWKEDVYRRRIQRECKGDYKYCRTCNDEIGCNRRPFTRKGAMRDDDTDDDEDSDLDFGFKKMVVSPYWDGLDEEFPHRGPAVQPGLAFTGLQPETQPETQPEVQPEVQPETQPEVRPEVQPEVQPEAQPEVHPVEPEAQEAKPETQPEFEPEAPKVDPKTQPKVEPEAPENEPETQPEVNPEDHPKIQPEDKPEIEVEVAPEQTPPLAGMHCYKCDSSENPSCRDNPSGSETCKSEHNECFTALYNQYSKLVRGCIGDPEPYYPAKNPDQLRLCGSSLCNTHQLVEENCHAFKYTKNDVVMGMQRRWKFPSTKCHPVLNPLGCYYLIDAESHTVKTGCQSAMKMGKVKQADDEHLESCIGDECIESTTFLTCLAHGPSDSFELGTETANVRLERCTGQCFTYTHNAESVERGCLSNASPKVSKGCAANNRRCALCDDDIGCNREEAREIDDDENGSDDDSDGDNAESSESDSSDEAEEVATDEDNNNETSQSRPHEEPRGASQLELQLDEQAEAQPEQQPELQPEHQPEPQPEPQSEPQPEPEPEKQKKTILGGLWKGLCG